MSVRHALEGLKETGYPKGSVLHDVFETTRNWILGFTITFVSQMTTFFDNGGVSKNDMHYYGLENPWWIRKGRFRTIYSTNSWYGILGNQIIGSFFSRNSLNRNCFISAFWKCKFTNNIRGMVPTIWGTSVLPLNSAKSSWFGFT